MTRKLVSRIASSVLLSLLFSTPEAFACGEPLFKMGKGVRYQPIVAPLPARVLVYAPVAGDGRKIELPQLSSTLRSVGHEVMEAAQPSEVTRLLREGGYDIVIAAYGDLDAVLPSIEEAPSRPEILPVLVTVPDLQDATIRARFPEVLVGRLDHLRRNCKAVQRVMEERVR